MTAKAPKETLTLTQTENGFEVLLHGKNLRFRGATREDALINAGRFLADAAALMSLSSAAAYLDANPTPKKETA